MRLPTDPNLPADQPLPLKGTSLHIFPVPGAFDDLLDRNGGIFDVTLEAIGVMEVGAQGVGNPMLGLLLRLPDGRQVLGRILLKHYLHAGTAVITNANAPPPDRAGLRAALNPDRTDGRAGVISPRRNAG